jgi:RNA polymerase sigma factor (sigma-70 family)
MTRVRRRTAFVVWLPRAARALVPPRTIVYRGRLLPEDAISEALVKALHMEAETPGYFRSAEHLVNWLKRTAYWAMINAYRRARRDPSRPLPAGNEGSLVDPRSRRARGSWQAEDRQAVWDCLRRLPEAERLLLEGRYYERLTDVELARRLYQVWSASAPAMGQRARQDRLRAQTQLAELLREQGVNRPTQA